MRRENDGECEEHECVFHADQFLGWMVSLVMNYRLSFADEISKSGIDGLIKVLINKTR